MRDILFRGKRVDGKGWAQGSLLKFWRPDEPKYVAIVGWKGDHFEVIPETVGQLRYTNDKGVKYFDNDVYYHAGYGLRVVSDLCELQLALISGNSDNVGKIKGNIHDNPELLQ